MDLSSATDLIGSLDEVPALLDIANRRNLRFGIRGGVLRNIALRSGSPERSIFDYVDPFSGHRRSC